MIVALPHAWLATRDKTKNECVASKVSPKHEECHVDDVVDGGSFLVV